MINAWKCLETHLNCIDNTWLMQGKYLENQQLVPAIEAFQKADDSSRFMEVIILNRESEDREDEKLLKFLDMTRSVKKEREIDNEYIYCLSRLERLPALEKFLNSFNSADISTTATQVHGVFVADMDNDGDMDIVSASTDIDAIAWYENDGAADPSWTAADIATSADGAFSVFAADMDNDGDMDIVSASYIDDAIACQTGSAKPVQFTTSESDVHAVAVASDGKKAMQN